MEHIVEVNGEKYLLNQKDARKRPSSKIMSMLAAATLMGGAYGYGSTYSRQRPNVDIVKEYELIKQKKSSLSANDRDWVVAMFERNYTKIITP